MSSVRAKASISAIIILALVAGGLVGCGGAERAPGYAEEPAEPAKEQARDAPAPRQSKMADDAELAAASTEEGREPLAATMAPEKPAERKRIYSGFCRLIVDSEEIEGIRLRLENLKRQIAFSRITVELIPRLPIGELSKAGIPFPWIASLEPVYGSLPRLRGRASLPLGEDFAVLEKRRSYRTDRFRQNHHPGRSHGPVLRIHSLPTASA